MKKGMLSVLLSIGIFFASHAQKGRDCGRDHNERNSSCDERATSCQKPTYDRFSYQERAHQIVREALGDRHSRSSRARRLMQFAQAIEQKENAFLHDGRLNRYEREELEEDLDRLQSVAFSDRRRYNNDDNYWQDRYADRYYHR